MSSQFQRSASSARHWGTARCRVARRAGRAALVLGLLGTVMAGSATAGEGPTKAAPGAPAPLAAVGEGLAKAEAAVKRGGSAVSQGIQKGVKAANEGASDLGRKAGLPAGTAADARKAQENPQRKADPHRDLSTEAPAARSAPAKTSR